MKKLSIVPATHLLSFSLQAQHYDFTERHAGEIVNSVIVISVLLLFMWFILSVINRFMDFRLKNKILDKGIPDHLANSLLQPGQKDDRHINVKWFALLMGIGTGLITVQYTQPLDFHSIAYMAFSIGLAFLGYHLYLRMSDKN